jgi:hypothetical protein
MRQHHWDIAAEIEPGQTEGRVDGSALQLVTVIMSDPPPDPDVHPPVRRQLPAAVTLRPTEARELAFRLLELAEHAERGSER